MTPLADTEPLGHLTPFVVKLMAARVQAGEKPSVQMMTECLQQAVTEDNARCAKWTGTVNYESSFNREVREAAIDLLSDKIYHAIPKGEPQYNKRWLACQKELGRKPTPMEYIFWSGKNKI